MNCLNKKEIQAYLSGDRTDDVEEHLASCDDCLTLLTQCHLESAKAQNQPAKLVKKTIDQIIARQTSEADDRDRSSDVNGSAAARWWFGRPVWQQAGIAFAVMALAAGTLIIGFLPASKKHYAIASAASAVTYVELQEPLGELVRQRSVLMDSVVVKPLSEPPRIAHGTIRTGGRAGVVKISRKTGMLADDSTTVSVSAKDTSDVTIDLSQGTSTFTVEKGRYHSFVVLTPTARVLVTGTVFTVSVVDGYTSVDVGRGSVDVASRNPQSKHTILEDGDSAVINDDSVVVYLVKNSGMYRARERLLKDFLEYLEAPGLLPPGFDRPRHDSTTGFRSDCNGSRQRLVVPSVNARTPLAPGSIILHQRRALCTTPPCSWFCGDSSV
jgi:hypothetical protein